VIRTLSLCVVLELDVWPTKQLPGSVLAVTLLPDIVAAFYQIKM